MNLRGTGLLVFATACSFDPNTGSGATAGLGMGNETGSTMTTTRPPTTHDSSASNGDESSGGDTEVDTSGPPPVPCGDGGICVGAVPDGWTGPIAVGRWGAGDQPLACPDGWPVATMANTELSAAPATCGCTCAQTAGSCFVNFEYFYGTQCGTSVGSGGTGSDCADEDIFSQHLGVIANVSAQGSSCAPVPLEMIPASSWGGSMIACQPAQLDTCDLGLCMPAVSTDFDERYCIMLPGDQQCPAGPYIARSVAYRNITDGRDCTPCTCDLASAVCNGSMAEFYSGDCSDYAGSIVANGTCQATTISQHSSFGVAYLGDPPQVTCTGSNSTPSGTAAPGDPVTFCCTPS